MVINQIASIKAISGSRSLGNAPLFKEMLENKRYDRMKVVPIQEERSLAPVKKMFNDIINSHEIAAQSLKISNTRTNYTPEKLLSFQYKTGFLLLREQMFARTAELSANTLKNFTQMQV